MFTPSRFTNRHFAPTAVMLLCFITGCTPLSTYDNQNKNYPKPILHATLNTAQAKNFKQTIIQTQKFKLTTFSRITQIEAPLIVYLEGDGHSRDSKYQISTDPTPHQPLALQLALVDPRSNILYIARPGQYTPRSEDRCDAKYWSTHRFAQEVVDSTNEVINDFADKIFNNKKSDIKLVGFSGGGGLAVLVAAHRSDVTQIVTIAGDLDPVAMTAYHRTMPLKGSLNPIRFAKKINTVEQLHVVGTKDNIVPRKIAQGFIKASGNTPVVNMQIVDASHHEGWLAWWEHYHSYLNFTDPVLPT